jgi:hypothetical protein
MMNDEFKNRIDQSQQAKRMTIGEWRMSRIHEETLPSGLAVKLRDVSMTDLLFTGKLPPAMLDFAQGASQQGASNVDLKELAKNGEDFRVLMDALVKLSLVEPAIGDVSDETHITLDELNGDDKLFIFNWANREVSQLQSFREGEAEPLETLQSRNGHG